MNITEYERIPVVWWSAAILVPGLFVACGLYLLRLGVWTLRRREYVGRGGVKLQGGSAKAMAALFIGCALMSFVAAILAVLGAVLHPMRPRS